MKITTRPNTLPSAVATLGIVQLVGIAYTAYFGFNASFEVAVGWFSIFGFASVFAFTGSKLPAWGRGAALGVAFYSGFQVAAYFLTTPTPPTTGEYFLGTFEGVGLLVGAVLMKLWVDAGVEAAKMDAEVVDGS